METKTSVTPVLTLLTDFGSQDGYVAAMMGSLMSHPIGHRIFEVSHDIEPQNIWQAALSLRRYATRYPPESIHLVVVDPGVGSPRKALALRCDQHWLIGPDNGVLSLASQMYRKVTPYALKDHTSWWQKHSSFDGLALFTPAAIQVSLGRNILDMADPLTRFHTLAFPEPELIGNQLIGQILGFDRFGNAITNISAADLPRSATNRISCHHLEFPTVNHYCECPAHGRLSLINSDRLLELALYQDSAQHQLQLAVGDTVTVELGARY
jgi:hypothetical protein